MVPLPVYDVRPPVDAMVLVIVTLPVAEVVFTLPAASLNVPLLTVTVPVPPLDVKGVNETVYEVPLIRVKFDSVPRVAVRSSIVRLLDDSSSVMLTVTDDPVFTEADDTEGTGGIPSAGLTELLANDVSVLESLNVARTVNVYEVPLVSPVTVQVVDGELTVQVRPSGLDVAV
jgi:hypothetical protein